MAKFDIKSKLLRRIAPAQIPELLAFKAGYLKVRLSYLTPEAKHSRNFMLQVQGIEPPYIEDVCIIMPCGKVFDVIETYMPAFQHLQEAGLISKDAKLQSFKVLPEDTATLAYVFKNS